MKSFLRKDEGYNSINILGLCSSFWFFEGQTIEGFAVGTALERFAIPVAFVSCLALRASSTGDGIFVEFETTESPTLGTFLECNNFLVSSVLHEAHLAESYIGVIFCEVESFVFSALGTINCSQRCMTLDLPITLGAASWKGFLLVELDHSLLPAFGAI